MEAKLGETEAAEEIITEEVEEVGSEVEESSKDESDETTEEEEIITIGDDSPTSEEEQAPQWVKDLRKQNREQNKENRELRQKVQELSGAASTVELGTEPTLENCDHEPEVFKQRLSDWLEKKRQIEDKQRVESERLKKEHEDWNTTLESHNQKVSELKVKGANEAAAIAEDSLSEVQQSIIKHGADNSAKVMVALGNNPEMLKTIADIKDNVKFTIAIGKLETKLKTTKRAATKPESTVKGSAPISGGSDKHLEKLEKEADKTGNRSKVVAYKRELKKKE
jgi:hypothetical protein